ncbi:L-threonylcarbamoyladenylate synthase [Pontixanthobacter sp.]|uniref:L-threonylcarbamoyladenylate synthase n=1 Tax=Pontixanthobacter sp. TaxID=2792078 RepID=UPI003C7C70AD
MSDKNATEMLRADPAGVSRAAEIVRGGGIVAVPTETVYGLAARADSDAAIARIYAAKGRPSINPLIVHIASMDEARKVADFSDEAERVAARVWPGSVTLVLPRRKDADLANAISAGLPTIAVRMPDHQVMRALITRVGVPLGAPSANLSNTVSPTSAHHVAATLDGRIDMILDGGDCPTGLESSILAIRQNGRWDQLRAGPVDLDALHRQLYGSALAPVQPSASIEAPGQLTRHYSPGKPVRLSASTKKNGEFLIGFGSSGGDCNLSESGNLQEAAARLYACLHLAAQSSRPRIAVSRIPDKGIGKAINDRLRRAAS